ncbi:MAG: hypothetical protein ABJA71_04015 [Ginsengibacter sp.]
MKIIVIPLLVFITLLSCNNKTIPDVSEIKIDIKLKRFEKDLFALDTNHLAESLQQLQQKYPGFTFDFINNILGLNTAGLMSANNEEASALKTFLKDYHPIKDSTDKVFGDFKKESQEIKKGLQFLKYYFPKYKTPESIITFIGPIDAFFETSFGTQGDIITREGLGIALQLHMGSEFSFYTSAQGRELYPEYISRIFTPDYIAINCLKNIIDDMYEDKSIGRPLIEQMVEKGKRLFLLDKLLPDTPDYLKISYTEKQLKNAYKNEAVIWDFFLSNDLLNNGEQNLIKNYLGESPKTQELGEDAPGNIGSFTGWQIVKKFMSKQPGVTVDKLMTMDAREIYTLSKYKPRS